MPYILTLIKHVLMKICYPTEYKYLVYFGSNFPIIHRSLNNNRQDLFFFYMFLFAFKKFRTLYNLIGANISTIADKQEELFVKE